MGGAAVVDDQQVATIQPYRLDHVPGDAAQFVQQLLGTVAEGLREVWVKAEERGIRITVEHRLVAIDVDALVLRSRSVVGEEVVWLGEKECLLLEGQALQDALDRGDVGHRFGCRVLAQAEQNQMIGQDGMEGVFRVQVQFGVETVGGGRP